MDEFKKEQNQQAEELLLRVYGRGSDPEESPLVQLISAALQEDNGQLSLPPGAWGPSPEQWDKWTVLLGQNPDLAQSSLLQVMKREDWPVPTDPNQLPTWAADLVLATLDKVGLLVD